MKKAFVLILGILLWLGPASLSQGRLAAEETGGLEFWLDAESGAAFTGYNDVQIPSDTGTLFSLADDLEAAPVWYYRLRAGAELGRHGLSLLYAPLIVESTGTFDQVVDFYDGSSFVAGDEITGTYKFNSYRLTYSYTFLDSAAFRLAAGLTGKIRDAYIALDDGSQEAKRTDLGFVPLIHLSMRWNFAPVFSLLLEGDGLAAPQGRAEDFQLALLYRPDQRSEFRIGYRLLEGGSDGGGKVYTFSMFHYLSAGALYRF